MYKFLQLKIYKFINKNIKKYIKYKIHGIDFYEV